MTGAATNDMLQVRHLIKLEALYDTEAVAQRRSRVRDFAEVRHDGSISAEIAAQALDMLNVDAEGFD
jgi:Holliday junction resolvasome RuvABC ATP-dependent DNA helicase subunit